MAQKKCNHCGLYKDEEEFNWLIIHGHLS